MDGVTLALDASTYQGSVAVFRNGHLLSERTVAMRGEREERLMPAVAQALTEAGAMPGDITHVVCGSGPGSFTSLRIAASIAKGIATATRAPLHAISSLALAAAGAGPGRWLVTLDALRGETYAAAYEWNGTMLEELLPPAVILGGDVAALATSIAGGVLAARPHARSAGPVLAQVLAESAVDLASWEPNYGRRAEAQVRWETAHGEPLAP